MDRNYFELRKSKWMQLEKKKNKLFDYVVVNLETMKNHFWISFTNFKVPNKKVFKEINDFLKINKQYIKSDTDLFWILTNFIPDEEWNPLFYRFDYFKINDYWAFSFLKKKQTETFQISHPTLFWVLKEYLKKWQWISEKIEIRRSDYLEDELPLTFDWFQQIKFKEKNIDKLLKWFIENWETSYKEDYFWKKIKWLYWHQKFWEMIRNFIYQRFSELIIRDNWNLIKLKKFKNSEIFIKEILMLRLLNLKGNKIEANQLKNWEIEIRIF